ncbi:MAG: hypothetical protein A3G18_02170 [Rhodospirillales bacterium RIFCSPLOWO2_12_FULL_58_28]|nr:MAG: hypothetical protein A3H92_07345 [Rhodospirillales bacterium RIFCSPLOWO2_02_FULL_58_16]OHC79091.1 MAG: hypothetical protein A3G18_02170 [Rhodospirillales bacterium RIFCSPLOWO2_12_FULL_58_28]
MDDFLIRALIGGFGVAAVAGPFGVFMVWRRLAYFGDTLAHAALLGVALGFLLGIGPDIGVAVVCLIVAALLTQLQRMRSLAGDTLLGILSHGALAFGVIALSLIEGPRAGLMSYLFGDILAVSGGDIARIYGGGAVAAASLFFLWRPLLAAAVHEELAIVEGAPVAGARLAFMLLLAVVVALAMKVVGILLVTALLIIPAAAARSLASSPEQMAALASVAGCVAVASGLWGSFVFDAPSGPSIIVAALGLFALSLMFTKKR